MHRSTLPLPLTAMLLVLSACSTGHPSREIPPVDKPGPSAVSRCDAAAAQGAVGNEATPALVEKARHDAGAETVRVLKPNQPVTLEFLEARLNVHVDANNVVARVTCG